MWRHLTLWSVQIKLLRILGIVGAGDKSASDNMYNVLFDAMRRANPSHTIGNAIIIECIRTTTAIYPNPHLLQAGKHILCFLPSYLPWIQRHFSHRIAFCKE